MWYIFNVVVPAGTTEAVPKEETFHLTYGVLKYLGIGAAPGCNGLVEAHIYYHEHQIFPMNREDGCRWSGAIVGGEIHEYLVVDPLQLKGRFWSPLCTYNHTLMVVCNVLPLNIAEPWRYTMGTGKVEVPDWLKDLEGGDLEY